MSFHARRGRRVCLASILTVHHSSILRKSSSVHEYSSLDTDKEKLFRLDSDVYTSSGWVKSNPTNDFSLILIDRGGIIEPLLSSYAESLPTSFDAALRR